jgi:hypothetical protein
MGIRSPGKEGWAPRRQLFFFFAKLGFELRALSLLGRCSTGKAISPAHWAAF